MDFHAPSPERTPIPTLDPFKVPSSMMALADLTISPFFGFLPPSSFLWVEFLGIRKAPVPDRADLLNVPFETLPPLLLLPLLAAKTVKQNGRGEGEEDWGL